MDILKEQFQSKCIRVVREYYFERRLPFTLNQIKYIFSKFHCFQRGTQKIIMFKFAGNATVFISTNRMVIHGAPDKIAWILAVLSTHLRKRGLLRTFKIGAFKTLFERRLFKNVPPSFPREHFKFFKHSENDSGLGGKYSSVDRYIFPTRIDGMGIWMGYFEKAKELHIAWSRIKK
jgi:hypothetical protein